MKNDRSRRPWRQAIGGVAALALGTALAFAPAPARAEEIGRCARVDVPWNVTLPDGSIHEAGTLKLCLQQMWTPASGLHEIRVAGHATGLFLSRLGKTEGFVERTPIVVFARDGSSGYRLVGYAWPDGEVMRTYTLRKFGRASATAKRESAPLLDRSDADVILIAAHAQ